MDLFGIYGREEVVDIVRCYADIAVGVEVANRSLHDQSKCSITGGRVVLQVYQDHLKNYMKIPKKIRQRLEQGDGNRAAILENLLVELSTKLEAH